jgi:type IV pilus assembly protein PilE
MKKNASGFTLIELVVALVIAAILAAIAVPSYLNYSRQSRRTEAKTALLDMAALEERYYSVNNTYSANTADLGYTGPWPVTVGSGYYQIALPAVLAATAPTAALPAGTPATYTLTAVAINDQVNDTACATFTLTSAGVQGAFTSAATPNNFTCWH